MSTCLHRFVFSGMCGECGETMSQDKTTSHVKLHGIGGTELHVAPVVADAIRAVSREGTIRAGKLALVLDLDHTLVHCVSREAPSAHGATTLNVEGEVYAIKVRPWTTEFLAAATEHFRLEIYTAGRRAYAEAIVKLLDPSGDLFGTRIVSRDDSRLGYKELSWTHNMDPHATIILDDSPQAWKHSQYVLPVYPFIFFGGDGVHEGDTVEPYLASALRFLQTVHTEVVTTSVPTDAALSTCLRRALKGVVALITDVFATPTVFHTNAHVRTMVRMGAVVVNEPRPDITHIITENRDNVHVQAAHPDVAIVCKEWMFQCCRRYCRVPEESFPVCTVLSRRVSPTSCDTPTGKGQKRTRPKD